MKKTLSIIAALVLALGMTQCKKAEKPQASTGDPIHVTFTATYGGERTTFTPADGSFTWSSGVTEYIYVGGSAHEGCIGTLSAEGNGQSTLTFTGDITPTDGETLHFFYLGKGKDGSEVTSLDFSSQDGTLGNLTNFHVAVGSQAYTTGMTDFSASLNPLVAFAYFDLNGFGTNTAVSISGDGVYSTATIDYRNGTIAGNTKGSISVGAANANEGKKYVALIPSATSSSTELWFESSSKTGSMTFQRGIVAGRYYCNGAADAAMPVIVPVFTVAAGRTVQFSPGNLQAKTSNKGTSWTWSFAANQWDYIGSNVANTSINGNGTVSSNGTVDMFGWSIAANNFGIHNSSSDDDYSGDFVDWGSKKIKNPKTNSSYKANTWRTMTKAEWVYLFNTRPTSTNLGTANARYAKGTVNDKKGMILFPDNYTHPTDVTLPVGINATDNTGWNGNTYSASDWGKMADAGAVFLPAAGERNKQVTTGNQWVIGAGSQGYYWSATPGNTGYAWSLNFRDEVLDPDLYDKPHKGHSVRLVHNAN